MRWIFILLLILNVVYFGWELDRETAIRYKQASSVLSVPASARRLQLISELPRPPELRIIDTGEDNPVEALDLDSSQPVDTGLVADLPDIQLADTATMLASYSCYRFGPVLDEQLAISLQDWFVARSTVAQTSYTEDPGKQLYWIYLAPQPSRENAMAVLDEMQRKGVGDFRLINRGDLQNAISLGLFSSREAVNARLEELKEKGYVPVVVPYANIKRIYSVDVRIPDASGLAAEISSGYPARFESVTLDCGQISASASSP